VSHLSLAELHPCCLEEIARYRTRRTQAESLCCLEIVQRAACDDGPALDVLLTISASLVQQRCSADLRQHLDDIQQEVALRLFQKFRSRTTPFQPKTFAAYRVYLQMTLKSVEILFIRQQPAHDSLEQRHAATGEELAAPPVMDVVERRAFLRRCLDLLPDRMLQAVFYRRFVLDETPNHVATFLGIDKQQVFRLTERAIRVLRDEPEIGDMLRSD
jgi:DNA-directed RNA polymerase specialized sigma24 family protein